MRRILPVLLLLTACETAPEPVDPGDCALGTAPSLLDGSRTNPWPSLHVVTDRGDGCRLDITSDDMPTGDGDPLDVTALRRRDGFSPAGTIWLAPDAALDPASLPPLSDIGLSLGDRSSVQLWDLDAGARVPFFAELDAWPEQDEDQRVLLVRPMRALPFGARVAVVITDSLRTVDGAAWPAPPAFAAIRDGEADVSDPVVAHYELLLRELEALGVDRAGTSFAWDYRIATSERTTAPLDRVLGTMREALPLDPAHTPALTLSDSLDVDLGDDLAPGLWREVRGSLQLPTYLWDNDPQGDDHDVGWFRLDDDALPILREDSDVYFTLIVPESLRDAPAGSAPVLVFGHGIFSAPQAYLTPGDDVNGVIELCNRIGAVCLGSRWRGLTTSDAGDAVRVATNLGRFPLLTDKLVQGVADQMAMARLPRTGFVDEDFLAASGGGSLIDPDRVLYYGISLGGIEGATLLANSEVVDVGALHVPGAVWATMLERSSHWENFETFVTATLPEPDRRQLLYAQSQLLWDPVDPINHTAGLQDVTALWQVSVGDEQVPNFTVETLLRTAGVPLVTPEVESVWGMDPVEAPLPAGSRGLFQFDSLLPRPPTTNRPAPVTTAHTVIRATEACLDQLEAFFEAGAEGTIIGPCDGPCLLPPAE